MKRRPPSKSRAEIGPSQRQLRAGELVRHALVEILRETELLDPALHGVSVTITQVRMSPDLRHAHCFVEPLGAGIGGGPSPAEVIPALNRSAKYLRGQLGRHVDLKFTPDLRFVHDDSFEEAARIGRLLSDPRVKADLEAEDDDGT